MPESDASPGAEEALTDDDVARLKSVVATMEQALNGIGAGLLGANTAFEQAVREGQLEEARQTAGFCMKLAQGSEALRDLIDMGREVLAESGRTA